MDSFQRVGLLDLQLEADALQLRFKQSKGSSFLVFTIFHFLQLQDDTAVHSNIRHLTIATEIRRNQNELLMYGDRWISKYLCHE